MDHPVLEVIDEKQLKNTGSEQRPFFTKIAETRWVRFLGLLLFKHSSTGNFPDPSDKEV